MAKTTVSIELKQPEWIELNNCIQVIHAHYAFYHNNLEDDQSNVTKLNLTILWIKISQKIIGFNPVNLSKKRKIQIDVNYWISFVKAHEFFKESVKQYQNHYLDAIVHTVASEMRVKIRLQFQTQH